MHKHREASIAVRKVIVNTTPQIHGTCSIGACYIAFLVIAGIMSDVCMAQSDFSDAPAPYTISSHTNVDEEWLFNDFISSTTLESSPLRPDLDLDDSGAILFCISPPVSGICPGAMAVAVGVAVGAPATIRRLNVVADMNNNGVFGDIYPDSPAREHVIRDLPINVVPGSWAWIVATGFDIAIPAGQTMWVRATLTRGIVNKTDWDGKGDFTYGETEDFAWPTASPPMWPPPNIVGGGGGGGGSTKSCVSTLPRIVDIQPNPVLIPPGSTVDFKVFACGGGSCCTRIDILDCRPLNGAPGPNIGLASPAPFSQTCAMPAVVMAQNPPSLVPILAGSGRASSLDRPVQSCIGFPTPYFFRASYDLPVDRRRWRCNIVAIFDPEGDTVHFYDMTETGVGISSEVDLIEMGELYCGDEFVETMAGEECDPPGKQGACNMNEVCNSECQCVTIPEDVCGNGVIEAGEDCDPPLEPGVCTSSSVCNGDCTACVTCGNSIVDNASEICDPSADPNGCPSGQTCSDDCLQCQPVELCGNGVIDSSEFCDGLTNCGSGQICDPTCSFCAPLGACCFTDGRCHKTTEAECMDFNGIFLGSGTECQGDSDSDGQDDACSTTDVGACCDLVNNSCINGVLQVDCIIGVQFQWSVGLTCNDVTCDLSVGACCDLLDGDCAIALQSDCVGAQPQWSSGLTCTGINCDPAVGACCNTLLATCENNILFANCALSAILDWSKGESCSPSNCPGLIVAPSPPLPDPDSPGGLACGDGANYGLPCSTCSAGMRAGELCTDGDDCPGGGVCVPNDALCGDGFTCGSSVDGVDVINNPWPKNRYIGFLPPSTNSWIGHEIAIRVTVVESPANPTCVGEIRWAGAPTEFSESAGSLVKLQASKLVAAPVFIDWNAIGLPIQMYGEEINPVSLYSIQAIDIANSGALNVESNYSNGLLVKTAVWGDVIKPVGAIVGAGAGQPNIDDVLALVGKWLSQLLPLKAISQLQPAVLTPADDLTVDDVLIGVNAWLGSPYPYGVSTCP